MDFVAWCEAEAAAYGDGNEQPVWIWLLCYHAGFHIGVARVRGYFPVITIMTQQGFLNDQFSGP